MGRSEDARTVWEAWARRQRVPAACKYTADRERLISKRLALGYSADDLLLLIRYAWESDDRHPQFWRGEHPEAGPDPKTYLDLANLLVEAKLGARVQAAREWEAASAGTGEHPNVLPFVGRAAAPARPGRPGRPGLVSDPEVSLEGPARWRR